MITVKRVRNFNGKKEFLEISRSEGFADIIIDPKNNQSVKIGVEMTERMIHADKWYNRKHV